MSNTRVEPHAVEGAEAFFADMAQEVCYQRAEEVVAEIRHIIDTRYPPASLAGEPPAYRTGDLWWGYRAAKAIVDGHRGAQVWTDVDYAVYLEHGTRKADGSILMAARPHIAPSYELVRGRHQ